MKNIPYVTLWSLIIILAEVLKWVAARHLFDYFKWLGH